MRIFTIGFTKKSAETFFTKLREAGVKRLVDVRLNKISQLAGFAKKDDLRYFASAILGIEYLHATELAPTAEILDRFKGHKGDWQLYERQFAALMKRRHIEDAFSQELFDGACLLCSEEKPDHCHRRLIAEYLQAHWRNIEIEHVV